MAVKSRPTTAARPRVSPVRQHAPAPAEVQQRSEAPLALPAGSGVRPLAPAQQLRQLQAQLGNRAVERLVQSAPSAGAPIQRLLSVKESLVTEIDPAKPSAPILGAKEPITKTVKDLVALAGKPEGDVVRIGQEMIADVRTHVFSGNLAEIRAALGALMHVSPGKPFAQNYRELRDLKKAMARGRECTNGPTTKMLHACTNDALARYSCMRERASHA